MIGEDQWVVTINGGIFQGPMPRRKADQVAERYQRGLCKHRDHRIHVEVKRDVQFIKETDDRWKAAKAGDRQVTNLYLEGE